MEYERQRITPRHYDFTPIFAKITSKIEFIRRPVQDANDTHEGTLIFQDEQHEIIMKSPIHLESIFDNIYAVHDKSTPNKYLVLFTTYKKFTDYCIYGMFLYYDLSRFDRIVERNWKELVLCDYDGRNGKIDENNTVLYKQTLLFHQTHRDTYNVTFFVKHVLSDDSIDEQTTLYLHDIKTVVGQIPDQPRILKTVNAQNKIVFFDLGSLHSKETSVKWDALYDHELCLAKYVVEDECEDSVVVNNILTKEECKEREIYPLHCVKCSVPVSIATYGYDGYYMNLGESYCGECEIRYSASDQVWKCCKVMYNGFICGSALDSLSSECVRQHSETLKVKQNGRKECDYKYPFKQRVKLTAKQQI